MKRLTYAALTVITAVVLVFAFRHAAMTVPPSASVVAPASPSPTTGVVAPSPGDAASLGPATSPPATTSPAAVPKFKDGTFNGAAQQNPYGTVQVQIVVANGAITSANAIQYPQDAGHSRAINSRAVPQLNQETVSAQSANIQMVSGASYTSTGYIASLQSALDQAHP